MQLKVRWATIILFVLFLVSCFLFIWLFRFQLTFEMKEFDSEKMSTDTSGIAAYRTVRYVKGTYYTPDAMAYIKDNPASEQDAVELVKAFGGSSEIKSIWDDRSRNLAQFYLMLCYSAFVLLFVANISLLCEVLATKYGTKKGGGFI